jgi:hypothetical protein
MSDNMSFKLIVLPLVLYLILKIHLLVITLQSSGKLVRVHIAFTYKKLSFHCIAVNYYSVCSNLMIFWDGISFNLDTD